MPTYDYFCEKCNLEYTTICSIKDYDGKDPCTSCGNIGYRVFSSKVLFNKTKVSDAEYNPAFGKIIKNPKERSELAKRMNMVEIGNEKVDTVHNYFDSTRQDKLKKSYDDL